MPHDVDSKLSHHLTIITLAIGSEDEWSLISTHPLVRTRIKSRVGSSSQDDSPRVNRELSDLFDGSRPIDDCFFVVFAWGGIVAGLVDGIQLLSILRKSTTAWHPPKLAMS